MYKISKSHIFPNAYSVIRISDMACIPIDKANTDYQAYLKWLTDGNEPLTTDDLSEG